MTLSTEVRQARRGDGLSTPPDWAGTVEPLEFNQGEREQQNMILTKPVTKSQYSEAEAAVELGVTVDELRTLITSRIAQGEEEHNNVPAATYQPSDLVMLRYLVKYQQVA